MNYQIVYSPAAVRSIERFRKEIQIRVVSRIGALAKNPRPPGSIKLSGVEAYRIRVGDYRIIYNIHDVILTIVIVDVGHRGDVYRR